jgi:hypothetical protein
LIELPRRFEELKEFPGDLPLRVFAENANHRVVFFRLVNSRMCACPASAFIDKDSL